VTHLVLGTRLTSQFLGMTSLNIEAAGQREKWQRQQQQQQSGCSKALPESNCPSAPFLFKTGRTRAREHLSITHHRRNEAG